MSEKDNITRKRYISVHMTWDSWNYLSDRDIAYRVQEYITDTTGMEVKEVTVWNDEDDGIVSVQFLPKEE